MFLVQQRYFAWAHQTGQTNSTLGGSELDSELQESEGERELCFTSTTGMTTEPTSSNISFDDLSFSQNESASPVCSRHQDMPLMPGAGFVCGSGDESQWGNVGQVVDDMLLHMSWAYSGEEDAADVLSSTVCFEGLDGVLMIL